MIREQEKTPSSLRMLLFLLSTLGICNASSFFLSKRPSEGDGMLFCSFNGFSMSIDPFRLWRLDSLDYRSVYLEVGPGRHGGLGLLR